MQEDGLTTGVRIGGHVLLRPFRRSPVSERWSSLLLALLLGASSALAGSQPPAESSSGSPVTTEPAEDVSTLVEGEDPWEPGYGEVPRQGSEWTDGDLLVSASTGALRPARGYLPLDVMIHNRGALPRAVHIGFTPEGALAEAVVRSVEVGPHERLVVWLPLPVSMRYGTTRLRGADIALEPFSFNALDARGEAVLVLGTEAAFQEGTGLPRMEGRPRLSVRFVPPKDAPRELTAYVGHAAVIVAGEVTNLPVKIWAALEAYAATGGRLALVRPPRDVGERLPLLASITPGVHRYGFGQVRLCQHADECGQGLLSDVLPVGLGGHLWPVVPVGSPLDWEDGNQLLANGEQPLLSGAWVPTVRFLLFVTLFVLMVGIGCFALAQRKKPVVLLIAVPLSMLLAAMASAVFREGFSTQSARYSLMWLDRERNRALTVGVFGYNTGLRPETVRIPALGALLGPDVDSTRQPVDADWTNGSVALRGSLPLRAYREWGEVAVVSTRARLVAEHEGNGLRVRNALGAPLVEGYLRLGGKVWVVPSLADGAEVEVNRLLDSAERLTFERFARFPDIAHRRFSGVPWKEFARPLSEGHFFAKLGGLGLGPTAELPTELREGLHFMQGRVDGP